MMQLGMVGGKNVMNTFKFSYFDVPKIDIQNEVVSVLIQKIHMFKPDKGRAFSYFSIVLNEQQQVNRKIPLFTY